MSGNKAGSELLGLYEVAALGDVTVSAVISWRKRFSDFPEPVVELQTGPVFRAADVLAWLDSRQAGDLRAADSFYDLLAAQRGDADWLVQTVEETARRLADEETSAGSPGVLLGRIQSGKTRAFLGVIAKCFDLGYDVAIVLTKGTKSLALQTLKRIKGDFGAFIASDRLQVHDIMSVPNLTPYELSQKLVFVVKKEDDNLARLLTAITSTYPTLQDKKALIVDDEADLASVTFQRKNGVVGVGKISSQIDELRGVFADSDFLQVTATPYALYLQPEDGVVNGKDLFTPRRPTFTVILPSHEQYVGGDVYFGQSSDPESPAYYFYREVPLEERDALKAEDRRRLKIENVLTEKRSEVLVEATLAFIVGGAIRRIQCLDENVPAPKYSFLFHTEQQKKSHKWQERLATAIRDALVDEAKRNTPRFDKMVRDAYADLERSVEVGQGDLPGIDRVKVEVSRALTDGQLMITSVNSDKDVEELLDEDGQLKLRTPFNMFIGGQILDRGITINNLIAFYYGRNPKTFQQDTVLQHSRMYGARSARDLAVTRFYAPLPVYQAMKKIHEFDAALREAFESGAHDRGVYFIRKDARNTLVPCSPNKLMFSQVTSIRPGKRLLPTGFQTVSKSKGLKTLQALDGRVSALVGESEAPRLLDVDDATALLELAYDNLEFDDPVEDERKAHVAALEHLSKTSADEALKGKVWIVTARDRDVARYRAEGRFSDAPDTKQQADLARSKAKDAPVLMLLRQNGAESKGWRGLPFWWPVIVTPQSAVTSIFASDEASAS